MFRLNTTLVGRLQNLYGVLARVNSTAVETSILPTGWETAKSFDTIPGPKPLPLIGNAWRFMPGIGEFSSLGNAQILSKLYDQYGKIVRLINVPGLKDVVMLYDADDVQNVFRNEGLWPRREGLRSIEHYRNVTRKDEFMGVVGSLVSQGEKWGTFRTKVNQCMLQPRVAQVYMGQIDAVAEDFVNKIPALRNKTNIGEMPNDFINELNKWAIESLTMIALDTRLGCLQNSFNPNSEAQKTIQSITTLFDCLFKLEATASLWKHVSTPAWIKLVNALDYVTEMSKKYINQSIERSKTLPPDHEPSVLERILAQDSNPNTAVLMAIEMMAVGVDTTSNAVGFLLYHLATNPDAQMKLHQEIDRVLPRDDKEPIKIENMKEMKYLKACVKESMRISPVVAGIIRTTIKDMILQGHRIPKNTNLLMGNMLMSNQEQYFKQPASFVPERWLKDQTDSELSYKKTNPFVSLPFGYGPRSCLGRRFADMQIEVLVTKILRKYTLKWHYPPMETRSKLINTCKSPLRIKMIDRN